jgi:hypothetical protein
MEQRRELYGGTHGRVHRLGDEVSLSSLASSNPCRTCYTPSEWCQLTGLHGLGVGLTDLARELDAAAILDVAADCGTPAYSTVRGLDGTDFALFHGGRDGCRAAADRRNRMGTLIIIRTLWLFIQ